MKGLRVLGILLLSIGLIGTAVTLIGSSALIVSLGIRTLSAISAASYITAGAGVLFLGGDAAFTIKKKIQASQQKKLQEKINEHSKKDISEYIKDSLNPEKTRIRFEHLRYTNPGLTPLIEKCLSQMDTMDMYQARFKTLLDANEAIYLNDIIDIIDESERRMCRNFRNIINCCILIENTDKTEADLDRNIVDTALKDNTEELKSVSTLLNCSVSYINNYNKNGVSDRRELDAWIKVMKNSTGGENVNS